MSIRRCSLTGYRQYAEMCSRGRSNPVMDWLIYWIILFDVHWRLAVLQVSHKPRIYRRLSWCPSTKNPMLHSPSICMSFGRTAWLSRLFQLILIDYAIHTCGPFKLCFTCTVQPYRVPFVLDGGCHIYMCNTICTSVLHKIWLIAALTDWFTEQTSVELNILSKYGGNQEQHGHRAPQNTWHFQLFLPEIDTKVLLPVISQIKIWKRCGSQIRCET